MKMDGMLMDMGSMYTIVYLTIVIVIIMALSLQLQYSLNQLQVNSI